MKMYEDSLCRCGHSSLLAHGPAGIGEYDTMAVTCHACKAGAVKDKDSGPGVLTMVRDLHDAPRDPDEELPDHADISDAGAWAQVSDERADGGDE